MAGNRFHVRRDARRGVEVDLPAAREPAIAPPTGTESFFQWQTQWEGLRSTETSLRLALSQWSVRVAAACFQADAARTGELAIDATATRLDQAPQLVGAETGRVFEEARKGLPGDRD